MTLILAKSFEQTGAPLNGVPNEREWPVFWRVEGSLATLTAVRPIAYFTWNAHTFAERWARRGGLFLQALVRPALYASHRVLATRILHALLRGVSRDRLDLPVFGITERPQNVGFFESFGAHLVDEFEILGVPNWALVRPAHSPVPERLREAGYVN